MLHRELHRTFYHVSLCVVVSYCVKKMLQYRVLRDARDVARLAFIVVH